MKARLSIVAGLMVGVAVAGLVLGGLLALAPDPPALATPTQPLVDRDAEPVARRLDPAERLAGRLGRARRPPTRRPRRSCRGVDVTT